MQENFKTLNIDKFVSDVKSNWCEELIMQFYYTTHFYPDRKIRWVTWGERFESSVNEWAKLFGLPPKREGFIDVYVVSHMNQNTMKNMH